MKNLTQRSVAPRYLMALVAPALMAGVMQITWPLFKESPAALFLLAIMFCGWYGGLGPGLLAVIVSLPLADYFFIYPYFSLGPQNRNDLITMLVLATIGTVISLLSECTHREKRQAEVNLESAHQAEQKYKNIFDKAMEGIFRTSPEGRFLVANPALAGMFGFNSTDELISERADISKQLYVDPERREEFKRVLEAKGIVHNFEYEAYRNDGSTIWVSDNVRAVKDQNGAVLCYEGIAKDITERKRAEEALKQSEVQLAEAQHLAHVGSWNWDFRANVLTWSDELYQIYGFQPQEFSPTYENFLARVHPEDRDEVARSIEECLRNNEGFSNEERIIRPDGEVRVLHSQGNCVCDALGNPKRMIGVCQDITERKRAERRSAAFAALAGKLSGAREPLSAAQTIADTAQELFGWESCTLDLYDANQDLAHPLLYIDTIDGERTKVAPVMAGRRPTPRSRQAIEHGAQLTLREAPYEFDEDSVPFGDTHRPSASVMTVPILHAAAVIGILSIQSYRPHAYDHEALSDLQALADHCGAALNRIRAEEELRTQKEILQKIFDHAPAMISFFDADGRIKLVNREWERWRGWSLEEILSQNVDLLTEGYPDPDYRQKVLALYENSNGKPYELKTKVRDGRVLDTTWSVMNLSDGTRIGLGQDITERKQAEDALRESEERYRELFENAKDATYVHDLNGRYISVNRAAEKLTGHTRDEIIGRKFSDFIPPEDVEAVSEYMCKKLADEGETTYETEVIASDGRRIPVKVSSHLIYEHGVALGVQGTARDITERKRAENQLRQAKDFSENLIQTANVIILGLDVDGNINIFNEAAEGITGYTAAELSGHSWFETLVPKDRFPHVWDGFLNLIDTGMPKIFENPILTKSGEERYIMWQNNQIRVEGKVVGVISFGNDITERKRAEEALRESEERFSKAFHSSPVALSIALLEDGRLLEVNAAFLRMTGYSREEVIGRSTLEIGLWANPGYRLTMTEKLRDGEPADNLDFQFRKKSGELRNCQLSVELIELSAEPCVLGIALDTTERIRAEEALQSYPRRLIEAQETERQSVARELHDQIGQVLTAIRINLQTVWDTCETRESRALIDEGLAIVDQALEEVRDLSFELRPSLLDDLGLFAALRWYTDRFARRTGIRSVNVIALPESTRLRLELETACFRIVQEALTNVVRHARARNVSVTLRSVENEICLTIKDDGRGFDAHSQGLSQFSNHLGLRGMKERALALGGRLEIKSSPARGTEISVHFPERQ